MSLDRVGEADARGGCARQATDYLLLGDEPRLPAGINAGILEDHAGARLTYRHQIGE